MIEKLLPAGYAWLVVQGLLASLLPRRTIKLKARLTLSGFENPDELEPKEWYVRSTRVAGLGMLTTGLAGLISASQREGESTEPAQTDDEPVEPIEVDIDSQDSS